MKNTSNKNYNEDNNLTSILKMMKTSSSSCQQFHFVRLPESICYNTNNEILVRLSMKKREIFTKFIDYRELEKKINLVATTSELTKI